MVMIKSTSTGCLKELERSKVSFFFTQPSDFLSFGILNTTVSTTFQGTGSIKGQGHVKVYLGFDRI